MNKLVLSAIAIMAFAIVACNGSSNTESANDKSDSKQKQDTALVEDADDLKGDQSRMEAVDASDVEYELMYDHLVGSFKVKGSPNILTFVQSLGMFNEYFDWESATIDKANGYFEFTEEGDGKFSVEAAIWNRKDGKKLFIVSYWDSSFATHKGHSKPFYLKSGSKFYYADASKWDAEDIPEEDFIDCETGFAAYLYNETTKELEYLNEPPFNNWGVSNSHRCLTLPQKGKDIDVIEYKEGIESIENEKSVEYYTLKWNGMTFDLEK